MKREGGCHCSAVRFQVLGEPSWVGTCYCVDCRKISGSTQMMFAEFKKEDLTIIRGVPKVYKSSANVTRSFCENCGSPLNYVHVNYSDKVELPIGAFDTVEDIHPVTHIWVSRKPSWLSICDDLPQQQ